VIEAWIASLRVRVKVGKSIGHVVPLIRSFEAIFANIYRYFLKKTPVHGTGASPSLVQPVGSSRTAIPGTAGRPQTENLSHRPVRTVSHARPANVAYHSPACMNKERKACETKDYGEK
jgi:hypothetical protein